MSLVSKLGSKFKAAFGAEIIGAVAGGALTLLLAKHLNPSSYGLLFLAISVVSVAKLFSAFGIAKSASRYVAKYKENDAGQVPHIIRIALILNIITIGVVSLSMIVFRDIVAQLVGEPQLTPFLILGSGFIVFSTLELFIRQILQGMEAIRAASTVGVLNKVSRVGFITGFLFLGYGAMGALAGYIFAYAFVTFVGGWYLLKHTISTFENSHQEVNLRKKIVEYSLPIAVTQSAHTIDHHLDKVLVGVFAGPTSVAYYTVGKQIIQFIETPMTALGFTLSPTYGSEKAKGNDRRAARLYETALSHGLMIYIPAAVGIVMLAEPGIRLIFGREYIGAVPVLRIFSGFAVLQSITKLTSHGLDYLGRARERAIVKGVTAILNVVLNIIVIPIFGVVGAAAATVVTFSIYTLLNIALMASELDLRTNWLLRRASYSVGIALIMAVTIFPLLGLVSNLFALFGVVFLGIAVWMGCIYQFSLIDFDRLNVAI